MAMPGKTVCVTGASGFIASWLVKLLLERGYTVRGTVRNPGRLRAQHSRVCCLLFSHFGFGGPDYSVSDCVLLLLLLFGHRAFNCGHLLLVSCVLMCCVVSCFAQRNPSTFWSCLAQASVWSWSRQISSSPEPSIPRCWAVMVFSTRRRLSFTRTSQTPKFVTVSLPSLRLLSFSFPYQSISHYMTQLNSSIDHDTKCFPKLCPPMNFQKCLVWKSGSKQAVTNLGQFSYVTFLLCETLPDRYVACIPHINKLFAKTPLMVLLQAQLIDPAVKGTVNVLDSCIKAKPRRIVLTSSVAAVAYTPKREGASVVDERFFSDPDTCRKEQVSLSWFFLSLLTRFTKNCARRSLVLPVQVSMFVFINSGHSLLQRWYVLSKTLAELAAWDYVKEHNLDMVTINPTMVIGPVLQSSMNASTEIVLDYLNGKNQVHGSSVAFCLWITAYSLVAHDRICDTFRHYEDVWQPFPRVGWREGCGYGAYSGVWEAGSWGALHLQRAHPSQWRLCCCDEKTFSPVPYCGQVSPSIFLECPYCELMNNDLCSSVMSMLRVPCLVSKMGICWAGGDDHLARKRMWRCWFACEFYRESAVNLTVIGCHVFDLSGMQMTRHELRYTTCPVRRWKNLVSHSNRWRMFCMRPSQVWKSSSTWIDLVFAPRQWRIEFCWSVCNRVYTSSEY